MPKFRFDQYQPDLDPESEDYNPPKQELEQDAANERAVRESLADIWLEIRDKGIGQTYFWGPEEEYKEEKLVRDPYDIFSEISYLEIDYLSQIKDPATKKELIDRIAKIEKIVYKHYIPFLDKSIELFGYYNSPEEKYFNQRKANDHLEKVEGEFFSGAEAAAEHSIDLGDEKEKIIFHAELGNLKSKLASYKKEPRYFTFERELIDIGSKWERFRFENMMANFGPQRIKISDDGGSRQENLRKFDEVLEKAESLKELATRMQDAETKDRSLKIANSFIYSMQREKMVYEQPERILRLEAKAKDVWQKAESGEMKSTVELNEILDEIKQVEKDGIWTDSYGRIMEEIKYRVNMAKRKLQGEEFVFEEAPKTRHDINKVPWACGVLGVKSTAKYEELRSAYRELAYKYHPDRVNNSEEANASAVENMKKINEAYDLLKKVATANKE